MKKDFQGIGSAYRSRIRLIPGPFLLDPGASELPPREGDADWMVGEIRRVLEDDSLDDFTCIDRILAIYAEVGVSVRYRHDFG